MGRLVIIAPLKDGKEARVRELLRGGPPFALEETAFDRHAVHLTDREAVFVFEGQGPSSTLELPGEETELWRAAEAWSECIAEQPRVARTAFSWQRVEGPEGVSFEPTPGVGDSEGGDVYSP
jgi:hypothetical protein